MKHVTFCLLPENKAKRATVSDRIAIHFQPTLEMLCRQRDCFWRLAINEPACPQFWLPLAREADALIETLAPDFSI